MVHIIISCLVLLLLSFFFKFICFKVLPEKHSLKMIKNYSVQVNWFVFLVRHRDLNMINPH